jgi:hypothetical protein
MGHSTERCIDFTLYRAEKNMGAEHRCLWEFAENLDGASGFIQSQKGNLNYRHAHIMTFLST